MTMLGGLRLYLVRHAESAPGEPDALRPLTAAGREQARSLGERLVAHGVQPDAVLTSPLLRARETGAELARAARTETVADERLAPGATAESLREAVEGRGETLVVVAHQPDCGRIAHQLTGGGEPPFPPAGMVVIDVPE